MPDAQLVELLDSGTRRLVRSVDRMTDAQWREPSLLPGWSRGHVVAHLTLNAEGLSGALEGVHEGRRVPMYTSQEARDGDIADLATAPPSQVRDRFLASTTVIGQWVEELADNLTDVVIERTPGGRTFPAGEVGQMRLREVEIHHADLDVGYAPADWSPAFTTYLLDYLADDRGRQHDLTLRTPTREVVVGSGGPVVEGAEHDLAWWLLGRGSGAGLSGEVPTLGAWR